MHLGSRLNENQGTNKACNNVFWQADYKTGQTLLYLLMAYHVFFPERNKSEIDMASYNMS